MTVPVGNLKRNPVEEEFISITRYQVLWVLKMLSSSEARIYDVRRTWRMVNKTSRAYPA
jgi:hypothetical protein